MPQTLLLSTTDRNCRPTWHKFQPPQGEKRVHHTQYTTTHTQYTHLAGPFRVFWQNLRPVAPKHEKPHTLPHLYIYISYLPSPYLKCLLNGLCSGTGSGIQCFFNSGIQDGAKPGSGISDKYLDLGSYFQELRNKFFG